MVAYTTIMLRLSDIKIKIKYQLGYLVLDADHYPTALGLNNQLHFSDNFDGKLNLSKNALGLAWTPQASAHLYCHL